MAVTQSYLQGQNNKRDSINNQLSAILIRLRIQPKQWQKLSQEFEIIFNFFVGDGLAINKNW